MQLTLFCHLGINFCGAKTEEIKSGHNDKIVNFHIKNMAHTNWFDYLKIEPKV